jgi:predicted nucleotidyltransferase
MSASVFDLYDLADELELALGRKVDVLETPQRRTRVATQIRREAVPL